MSSEPTADDSRPLSDDCNATTVQTNVSVVMLTLNEADNIEATLDSVEPAMDELVLVDGDSDDGTVEIARQWCERHGKDFRLVSSSEREYLSEGPGAQRRRGERAATRDYVMALGADVRVEIEDPEWFQREFSHYAYAHTRVKPSGKVERDWRLYMPFPPWADGDQPRWRGMVHEEIQTREGMHVSNIYEIAEAPMTHLQQRHGAMDVRTVQGDFHHAHDSRSGGNDGMALKKQHFLLRQAMGSESQSRYLHWRWHDYYNKHARLVTEDYREVREAYDLPQLAFEDDEATDGHGAPWWKLDEGEPLMSAESTSATDRIKSVLSL